MPVTLLPVIAKRSADLPVKTSLFLSSTRAKTTACYITLAQINLKVSGMHGARNWLNRILTFGAYGFLKMLTSATQASVRGPTSAAQASVRGPTSAAQASVRGPTSTTQA